MLKNRLSLHTWRQEPSSPSPTSPHRASNRPSRKCPAACCGHRHPHPTGKTFSNGSFIPARPVERRVSALRGGAFLDALRQHFEVERFGDEGLATDIRAVLTGFLACHNGGEKDQRDFFQIPVRPELFCHCAATP